MKKDRIKIIKYNHSLDKESQTQLFFHGYLNISEDGNDLQIWNRHSKIKPTYINDPDYRVIEQKRAEF